MDFKGDGFLLFNNESHLKNHLHYLLRTESHQERTNEHTKKNLLFIPTKTGNVDVSVFSESLNERKLFEKKFMKETLGDLSYKDLCMGRFDWPDSKEYGFTNEMKGKVFKMIAEIEEQFGKVLLCVAHLDQLETYVHIHFLVQYYKVKV